MIVISPGAHRRIRIAVVAALLASLVFVSLPQSAAGAATSCTATTQGDNVVLAWNDEGGGDRHVVRRNGSWLSTPGSNVSSFVDTEPTAGAAYVLVTWRRGTQTTTVCQAGGTPAPVTGCSLTELAGAVVLDWQDNGGRHIIRRNGNWIATPGEGSSSYTDLSAPANATYLVRTRSGASVTDRECVAGGNPAPTVGSRRFVIQVSIDGLRADAVRAVDMPTLAGLADSGASTMNARTDPAITRTLPNHTSQFTGRFVWGASGHRLTENEDNGGTLHDLRGVYIPSVFDVVHDNGGRTVLYNGKTKFDFIERSYNGTNGAPDTTGADDGRNKIDVFVKEDPEIAAVPFVNDLVAGSGPTFGFFHIRTPDEAGHASGWDTGGYRAGLSEADDVLAELIDRLDIAGVLANTTIIVTADHGGPTGGLNHGSSQNPQNFTVPFVAWGAEVASGADLYALNPGRTDPGTSQPNRDVAQPIRGHDVANLSLDLLGFPAIPGSVVNADQSLNLR